MRAQSDGDITAAAQFAKERHLKMGIRSGGYTGGLPFCAMAARYSTKRSKKLSTSWQAVSRSQGWTRARERGQDVVTIVMAGFERSGSKLGNRLFFNSTVAALCVKEFAANTLPRETDMSDWLHSLPVLWMAS